MSVVGDGKIASVPSIVMVMSQHWLFTSSVYWAGGDVTTLFAQVLSYAVIVMVYKPTCASSLLYQLIELPTPKLSVTPLIHVFIGLIELM